MVGFADDPLWDEWVKIESRINRGENPLRYTANDALKEYDKRMSYKRSKEIYYKAIL